MNIFIASDPAGRPLGLILASSLAMAEVAFTSMKTMHHNIEEIDPTTFKYPNVGYLLTSSEVTGHNTNLRRWKRGL